MKKKNNWIGCIIDYLILSFFIVLLVNFMKYINQKFECSRVVYLCIMIVCIPIVWGTLSYSSEGKNTIGQTIVKRFVKRKNKSKSVDSK